MLWMCVAASGSTDFGRVVRDRDVRGTCSDDGKAAGCFWMCLTRLLLASATEYKRVEAPDLWRARCAISRMTSSGPAHATSSIHNHQDDINRPPLRYRETRSRLGSSKGDV